MKINLRIHGGKKEKKKVGEWENAFIGPFILPDKRNMNVIQTIWKSSPTYWEFFFFFFFSWLTAILLRGTFILYLSYNKFIVTFPSLPHPCLKRWMSSKTSCIQLPNNIFFLSCLQDIAWTGNIEQDQFSSSFLKRTMRWWRILPK